MTIDERLEKIEEMLAVLVGRATIKDFYEVEEFAGLVGKAPYTVREYARGCDISFAQRLGHAYG